MVLPPPRPALTVEVSLLVAVAAAPASTPPLPAVLVAAFVSEPVAVTEIAPVRPVLVVLPVPRLAVVVTPELAVAVLEPTPTKPAAPAVALADCAVWFVAVIVTSPSGSLTWRRCRPGPYRYRTPWLWWLRRPEGGRRHRRPRRHKPLDHCACPGLGRPSRSDCRR